MTKQHERPTCRTLIVRQPESSLTLYEQALCCGAAQCGPSGYAFISQVIFDACKRSLRIPPQSIGGWDDTRYSSSRHDAALWRVG